MHLGSPNWLIVAAYISEWLILVSPRLADYDLHYIEVSLICIKEFKSVNVSCQSSSNAYISVVCASSF